jgi:hypothetical protein
MFVHGEGAVRRKVIWNGRQAVYLIMKSLRRPTFFILCCYSQVRMSSIVSARVHETVRLTSWCLARCGAEFYDEPRPSLKLYRAEHLPRRNVGISA